MAKVIGQSEILIEAAAQICAQLGGRAIFVYADALKNLEILQLLPQEVERFITTANAELTESLQEKGCHVILLPSLMLNRLDAIKMGMVIALSEGKISKEDTIVCLTGLPENQEIDTLLVFRLDKEQEMIQLSETQSTVNGVDPKVFESVLSLALELAAEGREGKPRGSLIVLGDHELVLQYSRQMVINPFHGYPEEQRNILDSGLRETIKEFSAIDGAFVIRGDGVIEAAGRHLNAAPELDLPQGLGSRHMAAAGITDVSAAISFAISESTGTVSVFKDGKILLQIGKSQPKNWKKKKSS
ncbi:MAG: diadenylate cyclase [bacterium]|nr:diadenylate cyclase [bacterium]